MSFLKKIAKKTGKFLSKAGDVSGKILGKVGKITGAVDDLSGGMLKQAVMSNPKGAQLLAGYQAGKIGSGLAKGVGKAIEKGDLKSGKEAILQAQQRVMKNPELSSALSNELSGGGFSGASFGNRFGLGGIGG